ncbi:hypothetical protein ACFQY5_41465 [Paeniroseomonas aquatica]|uniref:secretion/conjugation apparatus DotM-related subunit n=1 Tax=Paeniroseomonas aquatica TaxID=373043 RepID=UPI003615964B
MFNPGLFAFVQLIDRPLYMALDSLGAPAGQPWHRSAAQAAYAEALGAREHWSTERDIGQPVLVPVVGMAANAIRAAAADAEQAAGPTHPNHPAAANL